MSYYGTDYPDVPNVDPWTGEEDRITAAMDAAAEFARDVDLEAHRQRVRDAAREKVTTERAERIDLPTLTRLSDFLAQPDDEVTHRIAGLWPTGGRVVFSAPQKAGKTTTVGNLVRSLADGQPFLDEHHTIPAVRIVLLDNELDENMLRRWLRDQGITDADRVELIPLRGRLSNFNILDPAVRTRWAEHIGAADVLIFDCLRPALDALGLSEDKDAGRFLEALDELTTEARIPETFLVHHMGHSNERSRGDSRILDWPDAVWKLVRDAEDDDEAGPRRVYFSAYGRDVDQPERLLAFDPTTRHLSVAGGSRNDTRVGHVMDAVVEYVTENPAASKNAIERGVDGRAEHIRRALDRAVFQGLISREKVGSAYRHTLTSSTSSLFVPDERTNPSRDLVPSSIGRGTRTRGQDEQESKHNRDEDEPGTCGYDGCPDPPRAGKRMCPLHFTYEPRQAG